MRYEPILRYRAEVRRKSPGQAWLATKLTVAVAVLLLLTVQGLCAQTVTLIRNMDFGVCDFALSTTYTVDAAASQSAGRCPGAASAQFTVTAAVNRLLKYPCCGAAGDFTVTDGSQNLTANPFRQPTGQFCSGPTGLVTVYVGATITTPGSGTYIGIFTGTKTGAITYVGTTTC